MPNIFKPALAVILSLVTIGVIGFGIPDLGIHARVAFITFALAIIGWTLTSINDTYIALAAAIVFAAVGIDEPNAFFETLGDPLIWMLFASFIIAGAVKASGLSARLAVFVTTRARSVTQLFVLLTIAILLTAFLIPSTSGRAALLLPVFVAISSAIPNPRVVKALALLFPSIILLSAIASLIGAGAHLMTADILWRTGGEYIGFGRWLQLGLPFALASCAATMVVIMFMFMTRQDRAEKLSLTAEQLAPQGAAAKSWSRGEKIVLIGVLALVALWATETVHGINSTLIAIVGALVLTAPIVNVVKFKDALKEVDWGMLLFMAATLELGEALIESGGAQWLVENLFGLLNNSITSSPLAAVALVAALGLLSHLVITSRSSRASVIIPLVIFLAVSLGFSPTTFAFMTAAATGFCLTLPVSAKPVAMFAKIDRPTYEPRDLLRLSGVLMPVHLVLLVLFAFLIWPALGLDIGQTAPVEAPQAPTWDDVPLKSIMPSAPIINLGENPFNRTLEATPPGSATGNSSETGSESGSPMRGSATGNQPLEDAQEGSTGFQVSPTPVTPTAAIVVTALPTAVPMVAPMQPPPVQPPPAQPPPAQPPPAQPPPAQPPPAPPPPVNPPPPPPPPLDGDGDADGDGDGDSEESDD
jgi:anion transporter